MKKLFSKEFIIGVCVIAALAILFFGIDYLKGINLFRPANFYVANYDNVEGLSVSAPVTIDGFKVGQVREINFNYDHPGKIEVLMALDKKLMVPEDSRAVLGSTLLSGSFVSIELGKSKKLIPLGGEIPAASTPDLMASLSNDVMPSINSILPKVDSLMSNLNALTRNQSLLISMNRLDGITKNVLYASDGLNRTMNADIPMIMSNAGKITGNLATASNTLGTVTGNLGTFTNTLNELPLTQTMDNVEQLTANLKQFSYELNNMQGSLGLLMKDPELYNRLNRISADVDSLIVDIQRNPKRYVSIKLF